jgi:hypothetical protein
MPVAPEIAPEIATAAAIYRQNDGLLAKSWAGLTPEEWLRQPGQSSNHLLWIVGHLILVRSVMLGILGTSWSRPWLPLFGRGAKLVEPHEYPSPEEITTAWQDISVAFASALEQAPAAVLSAPPAEKIPTFDGKNSGLFGFLAFHESYHVGQAAYLRTWLGHDQIAG